MKTRLQSTGISVLKITLGCVVFALGFDLFLLPNGLNAGGISGIAMVINKLTGFGAVGALTVLMNFPLFLLGGWKIGKKFIIGSMFGMAVSSALIDILAVIPVPETEPLVGALYGGVLCGLGLGIVFADGASTGGSDIVVRLLKMKWRNVPIGLITAGFDFAVVCLTGIAFRDFSRALYSGVTIYLSGQVINAVVYRFDYSKVVIVISQSSDEIAKMITEKLDRGVTYLNGEGYYSGQDTKVILTAIKKQQLAELKELASGIDPNAFIIVQEAHQVLGDGFSRYAKDAL